MMLMRAILQYEVVVLDWDAEYTELPLPLYAPPFEVGAPPFLVADALAEVERQEGSGHLVALYLREALSEAFEKPQKAIEFIQRKASIASSVLRGVLEAAEARLRTVLSYIEFDASSNDGLKKGVYLLSEISSIWERAALQQFLSMVHVLARSGSVPSILVVEEGGMGARTTFLRHLLALARRKNVKVIFIMQGPLPPPELRQSFELLLFDSDPELRRELRAAIPDSAIRPGECWWVRRDGMAKKLQFRLS
jgi:hypothetical protein